jgi:hypothetical protein
MGFSTDGSGETNKPVGIKVGVVADAWEIGTLQEAVKIIMIIITLTLSILRWL